jgi:hypothetical protein
MTLARAVEWVKAHRWWVALLLVVIAGYSVGKDLALRDNARDTSAQVRGG